MRRPPRARPDDPERGTILAGLNGEPCPPGGDRVLYFLARHAGPNLNRPARDRVRAVFDSLPPEEQSGIRQRLQALGEE